MMETERLMLRHWRETDAADLYRYASDRRVSELALWPCHTSVEMSREVIRQFFIPNTDSFAMVLKQTGEVIGCIGLVPLGEEHFRTRHQEREVGYWVGYPHWGNGYAAEALRSLSSYCKVALGLQSLLLTTDARNVRSQRVAQKCGFIQFGRYEFEGIDSLAYRLPLSNVEIRSCVDGDFPALVEVWERSVRATHLFLTEQAINEIRAQLIPCYFPNVNLTCILVDGVIAGFVGLSGQTIEMLFIDDCHRGQGLGSRLIEHAIAHGATLVDVNEQNPSALAFYQAKGFRVLSRDQRDEAGRPYPILHLSL